MNAKIKSVMMAFLLSFVVIHGNTHEVLAQEWYDALCDSTQSEVSIKPEYKRVVRRAIRYYHHTKLDGWEWTPRYRGFVGQGVTLECGSHEVIKKGKIWTSHGYLLNPFVYAGGGMAFSYGDSFGYGDGYWFVPIFSHVRGELHKLFKNNISPYLDTRIGYAFGDLHGFYLAPQIGCHFYIGGVLGWSIGIGYEALAGNNHVEYHYGKWTRKRLINCVEITTAWDF